MESRARILSNFIWRFLERCGAVTVSFLVNLALARLLEPELFGLTATTAVVTSILQVVADSGTANALIQKRDPDELDFSSVFWFSLGLGLLLYLGLFLASPAVARLYGDGRLLPLLRVLGLTVPLYGLRSAQQAHIARTMRFKSFFFATLGGAVLAGFLGVALALKGFGVWALAAKELVNALAVTLILWLTEGWRPRLRFSCARLRSLLSFGGKLLAASLLDTVYSRLRQIVVGLRYSQEELAFYDRGSSLPALAAENVSGAIDSVLLPVLSREQAHRETVLALTRRAAGVGSAALMPMMLGLAACAGPLVRLVLTERWLPCVPVLQIFCLSYAFYPLQAANLNALKALGRGGLILKLELVKKALGVLLLALSAAWGVNAIALSMLLSSLLSLLISAWPNRTLLGYSLRLQLTDILGPLSLSCVMAGCVLALGRLPLGGGWRLALQILGGAAVYTGLSALLRSESFLYLLNTLRPLLRRRETP